MVRDWWMRLALPLKALFRLVVAESRRTDTRRIVLALLAIIVLGVTGWCIASWLLFSDDVLQSPSGRSR